MTIAKTATIILTASIMIEVQINVAVLSKPEMVDYFNTASSKKTRNVPNSITNDNQATTKIDDPVAWFEQLDAVRFKHRPTEAEQVILSRPFNQDANRVDQWTDTAYTVAKRYRQLAQIIKAMPTPAEAPDLKDYKNLRADWYNDAASIFEDLIRPRHPARTKEELADSLQTIKDRSSSLSRTNISLRDMDASLRRVYHVHQPREDDALHQYVTSK